MIRCLNKFLFRKTDQWLFWIITSLFIKGLFFIFLLYKHDYTAIPGFWGGTGGDTVSYLLPIENFIRNGDYSPDLRMPGYGILYLPFALLFNKALACNLLILLQYIIDALSVYPLALIALYVFKSNKAFYLTFYGYAISTYTSLFDNLLATESFTTSFLIFSVFFLLKSFQENNRNVKMHLFLAGLCFTETVFLRPVFIPLLIVYSVVLVIHFYQHLSIRSISLRIIILLCPLVFFDGLWIIRNYIRYSRIIPLTKTIYSPQIENSYLGPLNSFVESWGGNQIYWDPSAEIRWFLPAKTLHSIAPKLQDKNISLPGYIYTTEYNNDSLQLLRRQLAVYLATGTDSLTDSLRRKDLLAGIREKCIRYSNSIKHKKPLLYYVGAPLLLTKKFLINSGTYNLFNTPANKLNAISFCIKIFYSVLYLMIIVLGMMAIFSLSKPSIFFLPPALVTSIIVYTIAIHPIILRFCEARYFVPAYPFMLICAVYGGYSILPHLFKWITGKINQVVG